MNEIYTKETRDRVTKLAVEAARDDLLSFIILMDPTFSVGPHHRILCDTLMRVESGDSKRAMIFVPPRSSKSLITSIYFPAWCLGRNPDWQLIEVSHSSDLSTDFGRAVRDVLQTNDYKTVFQKTKIRKDNRAADSWGTTKKGRFTAAGAGTGIAGKGANLGIIDDPISEQDAFSKTRRDAVNNWYPGGFRTRLMPGGRVVVVQTRWSEDDLSGDLLKKEQESPFADKWDVVCIPAFVTHESQESLKSAREILINQKLINDNYPYMEIGESFWPAVGIDQEYHWPTEELLATKHNMPPFQWDALYMQNPTPVEGGIIKDKYWQDWDGLAPPPCNHILLSLDTAFSDKESADYSAYTLWGIFANSYYNQTTQSMGEAQSMIMLGAGRGHWTFPQLREKIMEKYNKHLPDTVLIEKKASGQSLLQELRLAGLPVIAFNPERDKVARAYAVSAIFHNKRIFCPKDKSWALDVINECRTFPNGANDDYVDTVTQAILWMFGGGYVTNTNDPWHNVNESAILKNRSVEGGYY